MPCATAHLQTTARPVERPETDDALLRRYADTGDVDAFAEIVRRYGNVVFAASLRVLGDEAHAQDVSQETFFRLLRQPQLVNHSLGGWLHRSATNLSIDLLRSERARRRREQSYEPWPNEAATRTTWGEISPHIDAALDEVPEPGRSLLIRHFLQGVPQMELATELCLSPATVSRRIKAAGEQLQLLLKRRGIYLAPAALVLFCSEQSAQSMPLSMLAELGKMHMVGPVGLRPPASPNPLPRWTPHLLAPRAEVVAASQFASAEHSEPNPEARFAVAAGFSTAAFALLGVMVFSSVRNKIAATPSARTTGARTERVMRSEPRVAGYAVWAGQR